VHCGNVYPEENKQRTRSGERGRGKENVGKERRLEVFMYLLKEGQKELKKGLRRWSFSTREKTMTGAETEDFYIFKGAKA